MRRVCFYHAGCPDGFGAAWSAWSAWGETGHYVSFGHDDRVNPDPYHGAELVFADIMPDTANLASLSKVAAELVVLDHHWSAQERWDAEPGLAETLSQRGHRVHFDLEHSGAVLAWNHFFPKKKAPDLLRYVEDVDLWRFALPNSAEVSAAINSYPRSFEVWSRLSGVSVAELREQGTPLVRAEHTEVQRALHSTHRVQLGDAAIEAVNASAHRSRIGHEIARRRSYGRAYGLVYRLRNDRVYSSIYSIGDEDVSEIASRYGGGGHRNAAGFQVSLSRWIAEFVDTDV